jgi:hypothetical protein
MNQRNILHGGRNFPILEEMEEMSGGRNFPILEDSMRLRRIRMAGAERKRAASAGGGARGGAQNRNLWPIFGTVRTLGGPCGRAGRAEGRAGRSKSLNWNKNLFVFF